jgi:predicted enzyme related to lactoylglutathione lyase
MEYYLFDTQDLEGKPGVGGGLGKREKADEKMMSYIGVTSIDEYLPKIEELGGKILAPKMPVPGWGYLAICMDTENNPFGLWEDSKEVK